MNQSDLPMAAEPVRRGPEDRYGSPRPRSGVRARVLVVTALAALGAWLLWAALAAAVPDVRSQILDFRVVDDHRVEATVEVITGVRSHVDCTLQAQDRDHVVTGIARVSSPPRSENKRRVVPVVIETRQRAVAVTVAGCRVRSR